MKGAIATLLLTVVSGASLAHALQANSFLSGSAGSPGLAPSSMSSLAEPPDANPASDSARYADGMKAIRESRWSPAVSIFSAVFSLNGPHAPGAIYWKAYAQTRLGKNNDALNTCGILVKQFPSNSWAEDCGALKIEIQAASGHPLPPQPGDSDRLKMLALAALMGKDPQRARDQIEAILAADPSEQMREGALFILGQGAPDTIYPQIARINYLDGDVRIARAAHDGSAMWEKAVNHLPVAAGDSMVTGADGRVEIEFEDASTLYLAPNSVLTADELSSTRGVPHTELELLSGVATLHVDYLVPGETFLVRTPTNDLLTRYPQKSDLRIASYADALTIAPLAKGVLKLSTLEKVELANGQTLAFGADHKLTSVLREPTADFAAWDAWVAARHLTRTAALQQQMQLAGLTAPVPGLADIQGAGTFTDCAPYGRCWEPNALSTAAASAQPQAGPASSTTTAAPAAQASTHSASQQRPGGVSPTVPAQEFFPCSPFNLGAWYEPSNRIAAYGDSSTYLWAVCHSGYWIPRQNHYVWLAAHRIHHHPPIHWVRLGGRVTGFVPIHPRDEKGKLPVNRERGFTATHEKGGYRLQPINIAGGRSIELMKEPPREFRNESRISLTRVDAPHMQMRALAGEGKPAIALRLDPVKGFMAAHETLQGSRATTIYAPVTHPSSGSGMQSAHVGGGFSGGARVSGGGGNSGGGSGGSSTFSGGSSSTSSASSSSSRSTITVTSAPASSPAMLNH